MAIGILTVCLILMFGFEATDGFHDTTNAVATAIYANAQHPTRAVVWPTA
jgi:PiT family inorganic phosphate transporter